MLSLSFDEGCEMWEYMLLRYYDENKAAPVDYNTITDHIVDELSFEIAAKVFSRKEIIAEYVFKNNRYENHLYSERFIGNLINSEYYELADKLINLLFENSIGDNKPQNNLFDTLHCIITDIHTRWKIKSEGIDFLSKWLNRIDFFPKSNTSF